MKTFPSSVSVGVLLGVVIGLTAPAVFAGGWSGLSDTELLERSSESPQIPQIIEKVHKATKRQTYPYLQRQQRQTFQEWDLSITEREGISDLDREKLRQERARKKALRLRR